MSQNLTDAELIKKCERIHEPTYFNYDLYNELLTRFKALSQQSKIDVDEVEKIINAIRSGDILTEYYIPHTDTHQMGIDYDQLRKVLTKLIK